MISTQLVIVSSALYLGVLFYIAYRGDRAHEQRWARFQPLIYTLSLTVYCTTWTYFGAVGNAAQGGLSFFAIYLGPILVFLVFPRFLRKLVAVSQRQKSATIADFIASRYGRSTKVAALVTLIALIGTLPYISLQIKAIAGAYDAMSDAPEALGSRIGGQDSALLLTLILAVFAVLFGARTIDATAHHRGMMQAISVESVVKLLAFLAVAMFAWGLIVDLATSDPGVNPWSIMLMPFSSPSLDSAFITKTLLAAAAIVCLPRQFHVLAVEARGGELGTARWGLPLYLLLFSVAVLPITAAGLHLSESAANADLFVLFLPMHNDQQWLTLLSYLGGFSAATGMVIVSTLALSTMVSNDLIFPLMVRFGFGWEGPDLHRRLLLIRRLTIVGLMLLAYGYYLIAGGGKSLYSIGLLSFAAAIQFIPALVGGLYWRRGHRHGALAGLSLGLILWLYTLLLPSLAGTSWISQGLLLNGPWGMTWLSPQALFGWNFDDPLSHGVFWSLLFNISGYVLFSLLARPSLTDQIQASAYLDLQAEERPNVSHHFRVADLFELCARFAGRQRARQFFAEQGYDVQRHSGARITDAILRHAQHLLAGSVGTATAEHLLRTAMEGSRDPKAGLSLLLDSTGQALQFNREILQVTLDHIGQAVSVVDGNLRLLAWNRLYVDLFQYPQDYLYVGKPIEKIIRFNVQRGLGPAFPAGSVTEEVEKRLVYLRHGEPYTYVREWRDGKVIQTQGARMPDGGFITTFTDITLLKQVERDLAATNETLEAKVAERTAMLSELNRQLEQATLSKSRFLAAASHDLTQPLSASKLYMAALLEDLAGDAKQGLAKNALSALSSAETLLKSLLDISKLDSGALQPEVNCFPVQDMFDTLHNEFSVVAQQKGLNLRIHKSDCGTCSDRNLLRRVLQNFLANAIRYTDKGSILVLCRYAGAGQIRVEVRDSGRGIPADKVESIFQEFKQLDRTAEGVGLGLAISRRIADLLGHQLQLRSQLGQGSTFSLILPRMSVQQITQPSHAALSAKRRWLDGVRILCVDDDRHILNATHSLLERWGAQVCCLSGVAEYRSQITLDSQFEIVLMDYQLHDISSGLDLLNHYRVIAPRAFLGVLVTAEQDPEVEQAALRDGFQFLAKPLEPAKLRSVLHTAMLGRS